MRNRIITQMKRISKFRVLVCSVGLVSAGLAWGQDATTQSSASPNATPAVISQLIRGTQSGAVEGILEGNIIAFRGIPYAAPPIGNLRWRPPQPPFSWSGIRNASSFGNTCMQSNDVGQAVGSEDCLVLNVYVSQNLKGPRQPVMVFLHGGGNQAGGTHERPFDTPPLATHGVVVVTVEYRLGLLGYFANSLLTIEGGGSSGNYGLMDQIAALTWVQQNVAAFGGDPARVMVFGQSAGSDDVQALLVSPPAQGMFSAAGMESGYFFPSNFLHTLAELETLDEPIVSLLGCGSAADVLSCLRAVPADVIVNNQSAVPFRRPVIEPRVIPVDPFVALQQNGSPVPLLIGSTREEATFLFDDPFAGLDVSGYAAAVHAEWDPIGPAVADQVLSFYPATAYDSPTYALIAEDSDSVETCPIRDVARAAAGANRPPVWRYLFTHRIENNLSLNAFRAYHTEELFFVFGNLGLDSGAYVPTPAEVTLSEQLMGYWTRFAATGDPNGSGATQWLRYDPTTDTMLQLDDMQTVINGYHNTQCDFFSTLHYLFP
jgi:para-nitrobenzyl esterase